MLDINNVQSENNVYLSGILKELDIDEGTTGDGRKYIRGVAKIQVDQEIDGIVSENIIPVRMFSMQKKSDGSDNPIFERIKNYKEQFTSAGAVDDDSEASKVTVSGARLEENSYFDKRINQVRTDWQISGSFINERKDGDEESARFKVTGVIGKMRPEYKNDEETGRLIVSLVLVGYKGKANVIELIADGSKKDHIESNWNEGDTVIVHGKINMSFKVEKWEEDQGFGEPIPRQRTISKKELIIMGGSPYGLDESASYDADDIKKALSERAARNEALKNTSVKKSSPATSASSAFDF